MLMSFHAFRRMAGFASLAFLLFAGSVGSQAQQTETQPAAGSGTGSAEAAPPAPAAGTPAAETPATETPGADMPECAWIGQRVLGLLWRDDIDTANDFMTVYDRFGCPRGHIGPAFRCLVKVGVGADEAGAGLPDRSKACWANPTLDPASLQPPVDGADGTNGQQGDGQQGDGQQGEQDGDQPQQGEGQPAEQQKQDQQQ